MKTILRKPDNETSVAKPHTAKAQTKAAKRKLSKKPMPKKEIVLPTETVAKKIEYKSEEAPKPISLPEPTEWDMTGDFAAMLDEKNSGKEANFEIGSKVSGKLLEVTDKFAFFDLGGGKEGTMSLEELKDSEGNISVRLGENVEALVLGFNEGILLGKALDLKNDARALLDQAFRTQLPVEGKISGVNKGGYEVMLGTVRGFCPLGQIDMHFVKDPSTFVGQTYEFLVTQYAPTLKNVVLSRRAILEKEHQKKTAAILSEISVGDRLEGKVAKIEDYGVFIDIGGINGLVPNAELGYGSFSSARERMKIGDAVEVFVLSIDDNPKRQGEKRIRLSIKSILPDPFTEMKEELAIGNKLSGKVARMETFGAFVELAAGVDGLIHISEISSNRIQHPKDVLSVGQEVEVRVLDVNWGARKISLSLKDEAPKREHFKPKSSGKKTLGTFGDLFSGQLR